MTFQLRNLFFFGILIISCLSCQDDSLFPDVPETFGIRHDKTLTEYEEVATNQSPYNSANYPDFSSVVAFSYSLNGSTEAEFVATGTLIRPNWILTAGHNFFVAEEQDAPAPVSGISILVGDDPNNPSSTYAVEELVFHPTWIVENNDFLKANDLCLVKLSEAITSIPVASLNLEANETLGSTIWGCGYGDYSRQSGQDRDAFSKKHAIQNVLDRKVGGIVSSVDGVDYTGGLLAFDFDDVEGIINSLGDEIVNADEAILGNGESDPLPTEFEATTVQGDSGSPLFLKVGNTWKVTGVLSGGADQPYEGQADSDYGDISIYMHLAPHKTWIESVIN